MVGTFNPTSAGVKTDNLTVFYNDGTGSQSTARAVSGTGVTAAVLDIAAATFSNTTVGATSGAATFNVTNTGGSPATITARAFGTNQFNVTGGTCAVNSTIAVAGTCTVTATFSPTSAGAKSDSLSIAYNGPNVSSSSRAVSATGLAAASLAIAVTSYGNVQTGTTTSKTFTVTNSGQSAATVSSRTLTTERSTPSPGGTLCTSFFSDCKWWHVR